MVAFDALAKSRTLVGTSIFKDAIQCLVNHSDEQEDEDFNTEAIDATSPSQDKELPQTQSKKPQVTTNKVILARLYNDKEDKKTKKQLSRGVSRNPEYIDSHFRH
jgi:hypothetical protein